MTDPRKKADILKGSLESGVIGKEEYEKSRESLDPEIREFDRKVEELNKPEPEQPKSSEKMLLAGVAVIILLFAAIFSYSILNKPKQLTLEDMHVLNLKGKLKPSQGYVYKDAYSFVTLDNLWYTQLSSPKGTKIYNLALRYSPRDVKNITLVGNLNDGLFNNQTDFYVTFDPTINSTEEYKYQTLAVADFDTHMASVFEKNPIPACDRNETELCKSRPIVTCEDKDKFVLYIKESNRFRVYYNDNCIVVEGKGFDLVKGVDRALYNLYGIMGQEEI